MMLMDKIAQLRRSNGWSQEELAEKLDVTRQSVSKWESGQSAPDLERILRMSELFNVSTDALLKDDEPIAALAAEENEPLRRIDLAEAERFLAVRAQNAPRIAWAVLACILSFLPLMLLGAFQEAGYIALSEEAAAGIGLCVMLVVLAGAVAVFVMCGMRSAPYEYMEKDEFITDSEVIRLVKDKREEMRMKFAQTNTLAVCLCILSLLPLFVCICFKVQEWLLVCGIDAMLMMIGAAVVLFIRVGVPWEGFSMLLQEGDFARSTKRRNKSWVGSVSTIYWLVVTAAYLLISFLSPYGWGKTWVIWPIAAVLFGALTIALGMIKKKD